MNLLINHIQKLGQLDKLTQFLKDTECELFERAMQDENVEVIKALFHNTPVGAQVGFDAFRPFKSFIQRTKLPNRDYDQATAERKAAILERCMALEPLAMVKHSNYLLLTTQDIACQRIKAQR